jgi:hypothetical protein
MGALLPIHQFRETFGSGLVGSKASLIQGMYTIGGVSALPFVGMFLDTWGRRCGMFTGSCAVILGTIIGGTANHMDQLLASRFFLGMCLHLAPFWTTLLTYLRVGIFLGLRCRTRLRRRDEPSCLP